MKRYLGAVAVFGFTILSSYQNCGPVNFSTITNSNLSSTGNPGGGNTGPTGGGTAPTIKQFQPAVATRDVSCLACHANIQANLITDFGFPDAWYMGNLQNPNDFGSLHYMATGWQTIEQIKGQVIVPTTTVPDSFVQAELQSGATPPPSPMSLASYLSLTSVRDYGGSWYSYFGEATPATTSFTNNVSSGSLPAVLAEPNIFIGAPTTQEILALVPTNTSPAPWIQVLGTTTPGLTGLSIVTGVSGQAYVTNTGNSLLCSGMDVVINGTLLLNNLQVIAEQGGCRFYVTGSVFIEGPITYLNSGATADPTDNLQITSATSIIMGVGLNGKALNGDGSTDNQGKSPLSIRLIYDVRSNLVFRSAPTSSTYTTYANSILTEGNNIGATLLQDASVPGSLPTALSAAKQPRAAINFQHILLNAPLIHSRYMGTVNGVIVSESSMFSLGEFAFNYDPIFETVPVLPALPYDILCTSAICNPTHP